MTEYKIPFNLYSDKIFVSKNKNYGHTNSKIQSFTKRKMKKMTFMVLYDIINLTLVLAKSTTELNNDELDSPKPFRFETIKDILLYLEKKSIKPEIELTTTTSRPNKNTFGISKRLLRCQE